MASAAIDAGSEPLDALCQRLRAGLGPFGYQWLCACAIYPRLRFPLSGYLGSALAGVLGRPPVTEREMLALYRLQWFRDGYLPADLRLRLIADLEPKVRDAAHEAIARVLYGATLDEGGELAREPIAAPEPPERWTAMLRAYVDAAPEGAVERDVLFARSVAGRATDPAGVARDRTRVNALGWSIARLWTWQTAALLAFAALLIGGWASADAWFKPLFESTRKVTRTIDVPPKPSPTPAQLPPQPTPSAIPAQSVDVAPLPTPSSRSPVKPASKRPVRPGATAQPQPTKPIDLCSRGKQITRSGCRCPDGMVEGADGTRVAGFCIKAREPVKSDIVPAASGGEEPPSQQTSPAANPAQVKQLPLQEPLRQEKQQAASASGAPGASPQLTDRNAMLRVQRSLSSRGYKLTEDAIGGPATVAALRDFQEKNGLKPTGQPDPDTLKALGIYSGPTAN